MAKAEKAKPEASGRGRDRRRKSAFERQCLSKSNKRLFRGASKDVFKLLIAAERVVKRSAKARPTAAERSEA